MLLVLHRHPQSRGLETARVQVEARRPTPGALKLRYRVAGEPERLRLPPPAAAERADELWRTTCFEAFVRGSDGGYHEFNFAPSSRWAAYCFTGYRSGMAVAEGVGRPRVHAIAGPDGYDLEAELDLGGAAGLDLAAAWRLGLSAVLESVDGEASYWALAHPPGKPDFHHPDSFALDLPPTDSA